jgi:acetyl-CoA carboxylase biotin carboxylase subunit
MIGKLIVHGKNRNEAIEKMKSALSEYVIEGIETNIEFQLDIISQESFKNGTYDTGFLKEYLGKFL